MRLEAGASSWELCVGAMAGGLRLMSGALRLGTDWKGRHFHEGAMNGD